MVNVWERRDEAAQRELTAASQRCAALPTSLRLPR